MDATPIDFDTAVPLDSRLAAEGGDAAKAAGRKWAALHDAAGVVATLAGVAHQPAVDAQRFSAAVRQAPHWRREQAEHGVEDLAAIMEPGLAALISVQAGGGDAAAPALALWQEFVAARDALARLVLPRH